MGIKEISGNYLLILAKKLEVWGSNISCVCVYLSLMRLVFCQQRRLSLLLWRWAPQNSWSSSLMMAQHHTSCHTCWRAARDKCWPDVCIHTYTEYWENISEESSELCFLASHCGWLNLQYLNYLFDIKQSCIISTVQLNSKALEYYGGHISYLMWLNKYRNRPAGGVLCEINGLVRCV